MAKDVTCEVNSCKFWGPQNRCNASSIHVAGHQNQPRQNREVDCKTFQPKI
ncbi:MULTISPECIES: DUF1540 domain-containing protein [Paenibacillus]|uniref:DUF1540 domain-containing protein n=1 Tax=Paenibacillus sambharensis TaxID=1803190 RepID=A0A2W1LFE6_9BACL|nr:MULTISPECIES: DUF1540 domain-containing protein [Paenibacillus]MCF2943305.1 DUF1540 domain-containing protein [Paenibacillus tarimensis]PZD93775.1 DUF1540 domain-containing protein [Paenibacillus sambharensis]